MMRDHRSRDSESARRRWHESRDARDSRQPPSQQPTPTQQYPQQQQQQPPPPPPQQQQYQQQYPQQYPQQYQQQRHQQPPMYQQPQQYQQFQHQQYQNSPQQQQPYNQQQQYPQPQPYPNAPPQTHPAYNDPYSPHPETRRPQTPSSIFSSSSDTSSSLLDISRFKDTKEYGGVFGTFFKAPSERVRQRLHKKKKKRRVLYFGNSSSSSVNSDLAYGQGYVKQPKSRTLSPRSRASASAQGYASSSGYAQGYARRRRSSAEASDRDRTPTLPPRKAKTADEEIMALGQQLSNLARKSKEDEMRRASKSSGKGKAAALGLAAGAAGAAMASRYGRRQGHGLGNSKTRVETSDDDSDWEDASDDESSSTTSDSDGAVSAADSELAYGTVGESLRPAVGVAAAAASASAAAAMAGSHSHSGYHSSSDYRRYGYGYNGEKTSIVDPRLFGPYNSLRGSINTPCGFRDEEQAAAYRRSSGSVASGPIHMRDNYPGPSAEHSRFQSEQTSHSASRQDLSHQVRPAPVPLQQPVPKVPVSSKVYETEKFEDSSRRESRNSRQRSDGKWGDIAVEAAAVGAVGAAVAYTASRKESKERREYREDKRDHDSRRGRDEKRETDSKRQERIEEESFERERERLEFERQKALEAEQLKLQELERQKAQEIERQKALELERQRTQELERQKTLELERQLAQQAERHKELDIERQRNLEWEREYRRTHHDSSYSQYNERKYEKSSRYDDHDDTHKVTKEKEVEKEERSKVDVVVAPRLDRSEGTEFRIEHGPEFQVMREPEVQAESSERTTTVTEESRELPLPTGAGHHVVTEHEVVAETSQPAQPRDPAYDPFQYQVSDDAFTMSQATTPKRPLTPNVVTIEREPNFDDSPPRSLASDARLSRRDSFEIERMVEEYRRGTQDVMEFQDPRSGHGYEEEEHEAKSILDEAKHATIPVAAVAVASAVAVERGRQSSEHAKDSSRDSSRQERDTVQEEADRYYRETCIARKIASEEMRSRSASPERSVVDKWQDDKHEPLRRS
ncbi:hypothetical protein NW759_009532 [Fusarium solani]|nr:hypothetical protein NW759_009532 [Fusarium solani]